MGRHRRSAAGRAATGRAAEAAYTQRSVTEGDGPGHSSATPSADRRQIPMGTAPYLNPEAYAEATARAQAYLFEAGTGPAPAAPPSPSGPVPGGSPADWPGDDAPAGAPSGGQRHRKKAKTGRPVRAGLLGASAAVAFGTVAVATGVVPGLDQYRLGGGAHTSGGERVQAADLPGNAATEQGGTSGSADSPEGGIPGRGTGPTRSPGSAASAGPSASASASASPSASPSPSKPAPSDPAPSKPATRKPAGKTAPSAHSRPAGSKTTPSRSASKAPASAPVTVSEETAAEAEVLRLVNEERAKAGLRPLAANSSLTRLAEAFSDDMAARGFFDHTDPDGRTPWDRAAAAGVTDLGGENIARGQATAAAVVAAWMDSPGHRANILNPDFKTLGVGVHFGPGGPWWTQDFGY
ncbi:CAP domain-containing protein [Streptomyces sp. NPDC006193]|uniref:CAP domain-containing protein n=1 Tax=Streptomyces sp. NPDC006193 TaxID=3155717 RepID=UPI0033B3A811